MGIVGNRVKAESSKDNVQKDNVKRSVELEAKRQKTIYVQQLKNRRLLCYQ